MADETTAVAENTGTFDYPVSLEETGPGAKRVTVTVPRSRIDEVLNEQIAEARTAAALPGFRPGKAPLTLIEKRFGSTIRSQVTQQLISESYQHALTKHDLKIIGEPEFDNPEQKLELPESGDLSYTVNVETQPVFDIPDTMDLVVKKPVVTVTDEHVDQALNNLKTQQGNLVPVEDRGVQEGDYLTADINVSAGERQLASQTDAQIVARGGRIAMLQVDDLADKLSGAKPGEEREFTLKVPAEDPREDLRGQDANFKIKINTVRHLEPRDINQDFLEELGFTDEAELKAALREEMERRVESDVQQNMRVQVMRHLLEKSNIELPKKLTDRQASRVVNRRATDLMMRGVGREQLQANLARLQEGASDEAVRELKLFFILGRVAEERDIEVTEEELNMRLFQIAINQNQRPETVRKQLQQNGQLGQLYVRMREEKAVDALLENISVEEVEMSKETAEEQAAQSPAETPAE